MIGIVNYGMGNLGSVKRKLDKIKAESFISDNPQQLSMADKLILPGVGHFAKAVEELKTRNLWDFLNKEVIENKKPILGICLGMQLMALHSEEGNCNGFGWIDAQIIRFTIENKLRFKIPHMGWNDVKNMKPSPLFDQIADDSSFYFVHSYHAKCNKIEEVLCTSKYEYEFVSGFHKDNITGLQFHPEKSHEAGELLLKNFCTT
jgi:imidazole glycerol-phosphate synthase subunit HisH